MKRIKEYTTENPARAIGVVGCLVAGIGVAIEIGTFGWAFIAIGVTIAFAAGIIGSE
ncbi:MAG: hypothetical protein KAS32_11115 [Candidatus Peribacteraceae bacterium]|nr:hypothetical protein [Candidatus Peribacteraceae bacterium]